MQKIIAEENLAFIDGQNLYLGTSLSNEPWKIDFLRFRRYLKEKYHIKKAYYYIGYVQGQYNPLYEKIQEAGFILVFRKHNPEMVGKKKGNVDVDIVFDVMKKLYKKEVFDKVVLVSGDGDFYLLVDFLIEEKRFAKILFPSQKTASSLYKRITIKYFSNLETNEIRSKISLQKKKRES